MKGTSPADRKAHFLHNYFRVLTPALVPRNQYQPSEERSSSKCSMNERVIKWMPQENCRKQFPSV